CPAVPLPHEGRFAIVTDVGSGMRWPRWCQRAILRGRLEPSRTAKSCGPDTPTLVSSERNDLLAMGAREPGSPGRARRTPLRPLRREGRWLLGQTCGDCRQLFLLLAGHGRGQRPAFPAPSFIRGWSLQQLGRASAPRDGSVVFSIVCAKPTAP